MLLGDSHGVMWSDVANDVVVACRWSTVSVEQCLPTLTFLNEHAQQTRLVEQPPGTAARR